MLVKICCRTSCRTRRTIKEGGLHLLLPSAAAHRMASDAGKEAPSPKGVSAAVGYDSPIQFRLPAPGDPKMTQAGIKNAWAGSIVKVGHEWHQYAGVEWKASKPLDSLVLFSPAGEGSEPKARLKLQTLLNESTRGTVCKLIILGAREGVFVSADGVRIRVKELAVAGGRLARVKYALLDADGTELYEAEPMTMAKFSAEFSRPLGSAQQGSEAEFDFAPYPALTRAMRAAGALPASGTKLPADEAAAFLTGLQARDEVDKADLSKVAAAAEAAASSEKASPGNSRLKRASTGGLQEQSLAKKGRVVRVLGLNLNPADALPAAAAA